MHTTEAQTQAVNVQYQTRNPSVETRTSRATLSNNFARCVVRSNQPRDSMSAPGAPLLQRLVTQAPLASTAAMAVSAVLSVVRGTVNAPLGMVMVLSADALNCSHFRSYSLSNTRTCHAVKESLSYSSARSLG